MKKLVNEISYGKSSTVSGMIALTVVLMIGLGCFCNKDKFDFGNTSSNTTDTANTSTPEASPSPAATVAYKKADASKFEVPSNDEMQDLVKTTLLDFDNALQTADFTEFHSKVAKKWQSQLTPEEFKTNFQSFIDGDADLSGIKPLKANFTTPARVERTSGTRMLEVKGDYATSPNNSTFELKYIPEGKEWKLFGINVVTTIRKRY
jgi:hypothetical protein